MGLVILAAWGMPKYHAELMRHQVSAFHGIQIAALDAEGPYMVLVREDVAEAAGVDPSHLKQSLAVACIYAGQPHLGVIPIRRATEEALRDRLALEVRLLDDAVGIPKEDVLSEYEVEGQDYVIIVSPLNQGVDQLE